MPVSISRSAGGANLSKSDDLAGAWAGSVADRSDDEWTRTSCLRSKWSGYPRGAQACRDLEADQRCARAPRVARKLTFTNGRNGQHRSLRNMGTLPDRKSV